MHSCAFKKNYIAIVNGYFDKKIGQIDAPIARKNNSIIERCVDDNGDKSITNYYVIKELKNNMSVIYISLGTGRTHQIRVHMSYLKHPIIGDSLYGIPSNLISRQALHACKVSFLHPITKKRVSFESAIPNDLLSLIFQ